jgi:cell cycle checkpoint protein
MALQFACIVELPRESSACKNDGKKGKGKVRSGKTVRNWTGAEAGSSRVVLEAVTRRESSLALFHLMGKVLYNKRKRFSPISLLFLRFELFIDCL